MHEIDYEFDLGHFRGAIRPEIRSFRELPQWIRDNKEQFMEKRVLPTVPVEYVVKNFQDGSFGKASKTLVNFTEELPHTEKTQKFKEISGMDKCMFLIAESQFQSTKKNMSLSDVIGLMEAHVNVTSIAEIQNVTDKMLASEENEAKISWCLFT